MTSPWVKRYIAMGHAARQPLDSTLGDRVPSDRVCLRAQTTRDCPMGHKYIGSTPLKTERCK